MSSNAHAPEAPPADSFSPALEAKRRKTLNSTFYYLSIAFTEDATGRCYNITSRQSEHCTVLKIVSVCYKILRSIVLILMPPVLVYKTLISSHRLLYECINSKWQEKTRSSITEASTQSPGRPDIHFWSPAFLIFFGYISPTTTFSIKCIISL